MADKKKEEPQGFSIDSLAAIYQSKVDEAKVIVDKLTALRGTMAEWQTKGKEVARSTKLATFFGGERTAFSVKVDGTVGDYLDTLASHLQDAEQFANEILTAWIKSHAPTDTETTALRARLDSLASECEGFRTVIGQLSPDTELAEFPAAPKGSAGRVSSGGSKTSNVRFWRTKNGEQVFQSENQHSLSSMAFYHFGKCGVTELRKAIEAQHGKVDETKSWEGDVTVEYGGAKYGWHIGWDVADETSDGGK